ncbi:hypothetical protein SPI_08069 [Niveomyces insectorum RCEF 264]|uniref:DUF3626 domain-containing protein n=1 Tax=Niveomyces insectorum RCEF 264 TaxID=1081102 RepID=A0A167NS98_9HYPO|nr:hypothetical protein SPI_08069 [Niveomyces insectorum RCEF 264]
MDHSRGEDVGVRLHPSQERAISNVQIQAASLRPAAEQNLAHALRTANLDPNGTLAVTTQAISTHASVCLHFHPDRLVGARSVAQCLLEDGVYRSQFETRISNGSVSAHPGGLRDEWERALFQGAYHSDDNSGGSGWRPDLRPKYGALDLMRNADGPAIRFGSCWLMLKPTVSRRCTFTFGGSQDQPKWVGTSTELTGVLNALVEECFTREFALGVHGIRVGALMQRLVSLGEEKDEEEEKRPETGRPSRNLDHVIEAQVHGEVRLDRDVELVVADPSFLETATGEHLRAMSRKYDFPLRWHPGFRLRASDVPPDFRGPAMPSLAERIAKAGFITAADIGVAVGDLVRNPGAWEDRGTVADVLQELKLLWHVLVRFGEPADAQPVGG